VQRLRLFYLRLKASYLEDKGWQVPAPYQSTFVNWGCAADVQYIFRRFLEGVPTGGRVLVVGVMGGRDYFLCKNLGYEVVAMDVGPQPQIDNVVIHNVEEPLPFEEQSFDAAIVSEVLEHLARDVDALVNISRVLRSDGRLLVSLPFYDDYELTHVRIHSPRSGRMLLALAGFQLIDYLERPAVFWVQRLNLLQHAGSAVSHLVTGRTLYSWTTSIFGRFEYRVGHVRWLRFLRRTSKSFGGYYLCRKGPQLNYLSLNEERFTASGCTVGSNPSHIPFAVSTNRKCP
jgi:SAM-dependent methyltransferase